jgi:hypothetical protein
MHTRARAHTHIYTCMHSVHVEVLSCACKDVYIEILASLPLHLHLHQNPLHQLPETIK